MSTWSDSKIVELLERVQKAEDRIAALESQRAEVQKPAERQTLKLNAR